MRFHSHAKGNSFAKLVNKEAICHNRYYDPNVWLYLQSLSKFDHSTKLAYERKLVYAIKKMYKLSNAI